MRNNACILKNLYILSDGSIEEIFFKQLKGEVFTKGQVSLFEG